MKRNEAYHIICKLEEDLIKLRPFSPKALNNADSHALKSELMKFTISSFNVEQMSA